VAVPTVSHALSPSLCRWALYKMASHAEDELHMRDVARSVFRMMAPGRRSMRKALAKWGEYVAESLEFHACVRAAVVEMSMDLKAAKEALARWVARLLRHQQREAKVRARERQPMPKPGLSQASHIGHRTRPEPGLALHKSPHQSRARPRT
jgi:hypothetical protein